MNVQPEKNIIFNRTWVAINLQRLQDEEWILEDSVLVNLTEDQSLVHKIFQVLEEPPYSTWRFLISTNNPSPIGLTFEVKYVPGIAQYEVLFAGIILCGVYILIIFELVHRTIAAFLGSFVGLAVFSKLHSRPALPVVISWIDFDTCALLFGF